MEYQLCHVSIHTNLLYHQRHLKFNIFLFLFTCLKIEQVQALGNYNYNSTGRRYLVRNIRLAISKN